MHIGLIGYGKMGQEIERLAHQRHLSIGRVFTRQNPVWDAEDLSQIDVLIDFSEAEAVRRNIEAAARAKVNVVEGTTGWYRSLEEIAQLVQASQIGVIYAPNFSLGVQLFFKIIEHAGKLFDHFPDYDLFVHEIHHSQKADSPSGTALQLGSILLKTIRRKRELLTERAASKIEASHLHVTSTRVGSVPGTHIVGFDSLADTIELTHIARSRAGFALGALTAAEWIVGKQGLFTMDDLLTQILYPTQGREAP